MLVFSSFCNFSFHCSIFLQNFASTERLADLCSFKALLSLWHYTAVRIWKRKRGGGEVAKHFLLPE